MGHARALLPYALASVAVVLASAVALGVSLRPASAGLADRRVDVPGARARLSDDGRLAYWRPAAENAMELWVSDLDGGRRWTIAREPAGVTVAPTRWSRDGSAVAYARYALDASSLEIVRLDGRHVSLPLPSDLLSTRWRIAGYEWSPRATRIAVTVRPAGGASRESDVLIVEPRTSASWTRATTLGDALAGRWISEDELFVETSSGMIAVLDVRSLAMRPLTGMPASGPIIGRDGRVYFAGGEWSQLGTGVPFAAGGVWSATIDGDDLRRESHLEHEIRVEARLADGRFVVGVPGSTYVAGEELVPLPWKAGTIRRVVVSEDGRRAVGITESRVLGLELAKIPRTTEELPAPPDATTVILDGVSDADVWFPSSLVPLARVASSSRGGPPARLAFVLGRTVWEMAPDGDLRALLSGAPQGWIGTPVWSPSGHRLAVPVGTGEAWPNTRIVVIGASGGWETGLVGGPHVSWSPDGNRLAVTTVGGQRLDERSTRLYDAATGAAGNVIDGAAAWTPTGLVLLTDGEPHPDQRLRVGQALDLWTDGARTRITDAARLAAHPLLRDLPGEGLPALIAQVDPSADGRYVGAWVYRASGSGYSNGAFVVVRVVDGEPLWVLPFEPRIDLQDVAWSPTSPLIARTVWEGAGPTAARRAVVVDGLTGRVVLERDGRFGGWSPDGTWIYLARNEGLFAQRLEGGDPVRVSPVGVPVAATRP